MSAGTTEAANVSRALTGINEHNAAAVTARKCIMLLRNKSAVTIPRKSGTVTDKLAIPARVTHYCSSKRN